MSPWSLGAGGEPYSVCRGLSRVRGGLWCSSFLGEFVTAVGLAVAKYVEGGFLDLLGLFGPLGLFSSRPFFWRVSRVLS
jgi:hypothetical protein